MTLHYSSYVNGYPFFVKAAQHKNYLKLAKITGIESVEELRSKIKEGQIRVGVNR